MSNAFMGQHLLEKQLLTPEQLDKALSIQKSSNVRLGQLSINQGLLDFKQVIQINKQQRLDNKKFGDIAIENNLLSKKQVEQLLNLQKNHRKLFETILIEENFLSEEAVNEAILELKKHQRFLSLSINKTHSVKSLGKMIQGVLKSNETLFLRCLHCEFRIKRIVTKPNTINNRAYITAITIGYGSKPLCIVMAMDKPTIINICSQFTGFTHDECTTELAKDTMNEYLNCLAGYVISDVIPENIYPSSSSAFFIDTIDELIRGYKEPVAMEFESEIGCGEILIAWV